MFVGRPDGLGNSSPEKLTMNEFDAMPVKESTMNEFDAVPAEELPKVDGGAIFDLIRSLIGTGEVKGQQLGAASSSLIPSSVGDAIGSGSIPR
jgi:hypothetical protein